MLVGTAGVVEAPNPPNPAKPDDFAAPESDVPFEVAAGGPPNPAKPPNIDFGGSTSLGVDGVGVAPAPRLFGKPLIFLPAIASWLAALKPVPSSTISSSSSRLSLVS